VPAIPDAIRKRVSRAIGRPCGQRHAVARAAAQASSDNFNNKADRQVRAFDDGVPGAHIVRFSKRKSLCLPVERDGCAAGNARLRCDAEIGTASHMLVFQSPRLRPEHFQFQPGNGPEVTRIASRQRQGGFPGGGGNQRIRDLQPLSKSIRFD
jgi:hypothetical protein